MKELRRSIVITRIYAMLSRTRLSDGALLQYAASKSPENLR